MVENIAPGSRIQLKVVKRPTNAAATKTLTRLFGKDQTVKAEDRRQRKVRKEHFRQARRGGRFWDIHVVKQLNVRIEPGVAKTITASLDVLRDLKSISRFVEITPA